MRSKAVWTLLALNAVLLASLLGHETRFKVTLPPLAVAAPALELAG